MNSFAPAARPQVNSRPDTLFANALAKVSPEAQKKAKATAQDFEAMFLNTMFAQMTTGLKGEGPFTVFAPTDEAFAKLPKETVESLLKPENKDKLAAILKFHVIQGRVFSDTAAKGATVKTLNGQEVTTKGEAGKVTVGNATVTAADLDTSNGVIHVIDTVLLPK